MNLFHAAIVAATSGLFAATASADMAIQWADWSSWSNNTQSGDLSFNGGTIDVTVSNTDDQNPLPITTYGAEYGNPPDETFAGSSKISNIDQLPWRALSTAPQVPYDSYQVSFDFVDSALDHTTVFSIGQMWKNAHGDQTQVHMEAYYQGQPVDLSMLETEALDLIVPGEFSFSSELDFDAQTGHLQHAADTPVSSNSKVMLFTMPQGVLIDQLVFNVDASEFAPIINMPDNISYGFATMIPGPGALCIFGIAGGFMTRRRRRC